MIEFTVTGYRTDAGIPCLRSGFTDGEGRAGRRDPRIEAVAAGRLSPCSAVRLCETAELDKSRLSRAHVK
ncbi:MAG: hypothetical protein OXF56_15155 [Rhodobacteraceae bacterium]|nr:hypothetical protein [Paracoccaceae bacterium]